MSYIMRADIPTGGWSLIGGSSTIFGPIARSGRYLVLALLLVGWLAAGGPVQAQRYATIAPKLTEKASNVLKMKVNKALRNPDALADNQQAIDEYFKSYLFPAMTSTDPKLLGQLASHRDDLFKRFLRGAPSKPAQDYITKMTLTAMGKVALGNYHPAVRYNAVLVLGMLDQQYAGKGADAVKPIPLPAATNVLLVLLEKAEIRNVKIPVMLKSGALIGLERHAQYGIDPKHADRVTQVAIGITQQAESPSEIDPEVHHWVKCQAARVLARQFIGGPSSAVADALAAMLADENLSLSDRCLVASMLEDINYQAAENLDLTATSTALGSLSKDVVSAEAEHAKNYRQEVLRGGAGNFRNGNYTLRQTRGGSSGPQFERRRLLDRLLSITGGIGSVQKGASPDLNAQLQQVVDLMQPTISIAREKDSIDEEIVKQVLQLASKIEQTIDGWGKPTPPASAEPESDESPSEDEFS